MRKRKLGNTDKAKKIMDSIPVADGETRTVNKCLDCGKLFGRRFVPFGLGFGLAVNMCLCQLTANRPSKTILESSP